MVVVGEHQRLDARKRAGSDVERCRTHARELRLGRGQWVAGAAQIRDRDFHSGVLVKYHRRIPLVIRRVAGTQDVVAGPQRQVGVPDWLRVSRPLNPEAETHHIGGGTRIHAVLEPQPDLGGPQRDDGVG